MFKWLKRDNSESIKEPDIIIRNRKELQIKNEKIQLSFNYSEDKLTSVDISVKHYSSNYYTYDTTIYRDNIKYLKDLLNTIEL